MQQCIKSDISSTHEHREQWCLSCAGTDTRVCGGRRSWGRDVVVAGRLPRGVVRLREGSRARRRWSGGGSAWQRERGLCGKGTNVVTVWAAGRIEF